MNPSLQVWPSTAAEAIALQKQLASGVRQTPLTEPVRWIAGADVHYPAKDRARAAAVLLRWPDLVVEEIEVVEEPVPFPYIPGLLSFREAPPLISALNRLRTQPDLIFADAQGLAHPRRFGAACHLGLLLDTPTIGCAKSRLCGEAAEPAEEAGAWTSLEDKGEGIGAVVRTRLRVKPLYISVGHRITLQEAVDWVLACGRGLRLPEPSRLAHQAAGGTLIPQPV